MTATPKPPASFRFGDEERVLWERTWTACSWLNPDHRFVVAMIVQAAQDLRRALDAVKRAEDRGEIVDIGAGYADEVTQLRDALNRFDIPLDLARRIGLWPLGLVDDAGSHG